jgi:hypothetical protein
VPIDYSPTPPVAGQPRNTGDTEVERWTDYADTIGDVGTRLDTVEADTTAADLTAHTTDTSDAHDASAVSVAATPTNYTAATPDVEAHLAGINTALASVGGGGGIVDSAVSMKTSGAPSTSSTSWGTVDAATDLVIDATAGDLLAVSLSFVGGITNASYRGFIDAHTWVSSAGVNSIGARTTAASTRLGIVPCIIDSTSGLGQPRGGHQYYVVQAGDVSAGTVTLRLRWRSENASGTANIFTAADYPLNFGVVNFGQ